MDVEAQLGEATRVVDELMAFLDSMALEFKRHSVSSEMMRTLMLDLLDLAQVERGTFRVNNEYFDLRRVLGSAFDLLRH